MSGPVPNKFRTVDSREIIVEPDPNTPTFPATYTPADNTLFANLVALDANINTFQAEAAAIYVDGTNGNDANGGDELHPVATVTQAIVLATAAGGVGRIVVAAGNYIAGDYIMPDNWDLEGRSLDAVLATNDPAAVGVLNFLGANGNVVKNITIQPNAASLALLTMINCNGVGVYRFQNVQVIAPAAVLLTTGLQAIGGSTVQMFTSIVNTGAAGHIGIPIVVDLASGVIISDTDVTGNVACTVSGASTLNLWNARITCNNAPGNEGVVTLFTASILGVYNSILNNVAPGAGPNGYAINWGDASACDITLNNAKLQNGGTYAAAGVTVIPEAAGGSALIMNNLGCYMPPADVNVGGVGLDGFENGVSPLLFESIHNPGWVGLGGGATPFAVGDPWDQWTAIMRIARALDALINTVATGVNAGAGVALGAYTGGQIP